MFQDLCTVQCTVTHRIDAPRYLQLGCIDSVFGFKSISFSIYSKGCAREVDRLVNESNLFRKHEENEEKSFEDSMNTINLLKMEEITPESSTDVHKNFCGIQIWSSINLFLFYEITNAVGMYHRRGEQRD